MFGANNSGNGNQGFGGQAPGTPGGANAFAPAAAPAGFGGGAPQQGYGGGAPGQIRLSEAEKQAQMQGAMAGFGAARIDTRVPDMRSPYQYILEMTEATYDVGVEVGPYLKYMGTILKTNDPDYQKGMIVGYRITGAKSPKSVNFYYNDLKQFMLCVPALVAQGLTANTPEQFWAPGLIKMSTERLAVGAKIGFQMRYVGTPYRDRKTGEEKPGKLTATFVPVDQQQQF